MNVERDKKIDEIRQKFDFNDSMSDHIRTIQITGKEAFYIQSLISRDQTHWLTND